MREKIEKGSNPSAHNPNFSTYVAHFMGTVDICLDWSSVLYSALVGIFPLHVE